MKPLLPSVAARWALPVTGLVALVMGMTLPIVQVESFWWFERSSSLGGSVMGLAQSGSIGLALLIFSFSVVLPVAKLLLVTFDGSWLSPRLLHALGKWSMLDVFVVAGLVAAIRFETLGEASAGPAVPLFVGGLAITAWLAHHRGGHRPPAPTTTPWTGLLALLLFGAGLVLPVITLEKWGLLSREVSVLSAVADLAQGGAWLLCLLTIIFVGITPTLQILGRTLRQLPRWLALFADEWQMLGVFVAAMLVFGIKLAGDSAGAPGPGLVLLGAAWLLMVLGVTAGNKGERARRGPQGAESQSLNESNRS